ncbi:esterase [Patellaria atrata CBS 101060]|uniref:Esterase n=1 Tax=Patellaria atrata CBS 101060 TaxID=1346257 RepID=A0A9P4S8Y0_9PEZI|nr:esterase [Patellaria atrata CBS 101060]
MGFFTSHPLKALYVLLAVPILLARFPLWFLIYTIPRFRPVPSWSLKQALLVRTTRAVISIHSTIEMRTPLPLTPTEKEKKRFVLVPPAPEKYLIGPLGSGTTGVKPESLGALWYPSLPEREGVGKDNVVILHLHGGAFVVGDARPQASGFMAKLFLTHSSASRVFKPAYRLSAEPHSAPFPAAIQDSLAAYMYLLHECGVSPEDIILSGDSAGGNLVIALLRYLHEYGGELHIPLPRAAWLFSPWLDLVAISPNHLRSNPHHNSDILPGGLGGWGVRGYTANGAIPLHNPYILPLMEPFRCPVPLFVAIGEREVLWKQDMLFVERYREVGARVEVFVQQDAPHDVCLLGNLLGFEDVARETVRRADEWVKKASVRL